MRCTCIFCRAVCICGNPAESQNVSNSATIKLDMHAPTRTRLTIAAPIERRSMHTSPLAHLDLSQP